MKIPAYLETAVIRRRIRRMTPDQMLLWVDAAGTEMSRAFADYVRSLDPVDLAEFDRGLTTLVAMSEALHARRSTS